MRISVARGCLWDRAWWKPVARPLSAFDSNNRECIGPYGAPMPSLPSVAWISVDDGKTSGRIAQLDSPPHQQICRTPKVISLSPIASRIRVIVRLEFRNEVPDAFSQSTEGS